MSNLQIAAFALVAAAVVGGGIYVLQLAPAGAPATREFDLVIQKGALVAPPALQVSEGDTITLHLTADETEEFHLHGYDRSVELVPGEHAVLTFTANLSGRFVFELERSKQELGALEVTPR